MTTQSRRTMLVGTGALLMSGCLHSEAKAGARLAPVLIDEDRIIRIDVGLRPYRASGFRVERETVGDKALIHNYGHGGGGVTLSWGTAKQATDLGFDSSVNDYAVLGCGVIGLSTAQLLLERGARVRIYTQNLPMNTTSMIAGAQWWPASVYDAATASPTYIAQHVAAARYAFHRFQTMAGPRYGVAWEPNYIVADEPILTEPAPADSPMREFVVNEADLLKGEHPFSAPFVRRFDTMMIETPHYLRRLEEEVRGLGADIVVRSFHESGELAHLPEPVIFNCLGLGSRQLFPDAELKPIRGQLVILRPQPEVDYNVITLGDAYMFGRRDGIVLGGTFQEDDWLTDARESDTQTILNANRAIFRGMA